MPASMKRHHKNSVSYIAFMKAKCLVGGSCQQYCVCYIASTRLDEAWERSFEPNENITVVMLY